MIPPSSRRRHSAVRRFGTLRRPLAIGAGVLAGLAVATIVQGASYYWTGDVNSFWNASGGASGTNWSSSSAFNDDPLTLPGAGDNVFFILFGAGNLNTELGQDFSINSLTFTPDAVAANPVTIGGSNTLTLGAGGLTDNSPATVTLSTDVAVGAAQTWANNSAVPLNITGVLSGASNLILQGSGALSGPATGGFVFSAANSYSGLITLANNQTSLTLNGAGSLASVNDPVAGVTLLGGSSLILDNTAVNSSNRLSSTVGVTSSGGTITLLGNASAPTSQAIGTLTLGSGQTNIVVTPGAGQTAVLTLGSPSFGAHVPGAAVNFSTTGTINVPNAPLDGGGLIGGWATIGNVGVVQQDATGPGNVLDFATLDGNGNVIATTNYINNNAVSDFAPGNNVKVSGSVNLTAASTTINSLYLTGAALVSFNAAAANTLIIGNGGIISNAATLTFGGSGPQINLANAADLGASAVNGTGAAGENPQGTVTSATGDLIVTTASNLRIDAIIANDGGTVVNLTKDGSGTLDLSNGNGATITSTYTGITTINGGLVTIRNDRNLGADPTSNTPNNITLNGGELRMTATITLNSHRGITAGPQGGTISYNGGNTTILSGYLVTGSGSITYSDIPSFGITTAGMDVNDCAMNIDFGTTNYQGGTTFFTEGSQNTAAISAVIYFGANNEVPALSPVTVTNVVATGGDGGILNLFGSTQTFGSLAGNGNIVNGVATNSNLTVGGDNLSTTYSGSLGETGVTWGVGANNHTGADNSTGSTSAISLTKIGSGTMTLSGANQYTGATAINGGTVLVTGSLANTPVTVGNGTLTGALGGTGTIAGPVTVTSSGTLAPAVTPTSTSTLTISNNLTLNAAATLDFNFAAAGTPGTSDTVNLTGTGNLLLNAGTDVLDINMLPGFGIGTYNLITVTGGGSFTDNASFSINGSTLYNYAVAPSGNSLVLTVTAGNPSFFWTGAVNGAWNINTTANWTGAGTKYTDGGNVTFDDVDLAPGGATSITVAAGGVNPNSITFNNATNNYTFGGAAINVTSGTGIVKNQPGNVTFNNAVTTPLLTVAAGALTVGGPGSFAATGAADVDAGATLSVNGTLSTPTLTVNGILNVGGSGSIGSATALVVNGAANFNNPSQSLASLGDTAGATTGVITLNGTVLTLTGVSSYDGAIVGPGSLNIASGAHTLTNSGNTYSGGTTINGGILQIGNGTVTGSLGAGTYSIAGGATLLLDYGALVATPWANISGIGTLDLQTTATAFDWGTLALTGAFTGTLQIDNGHVAVDALGAVLGSAAVIVVGPGPAPGAGGQLDLSLGGTFGQPITIAGSGYGVAGQESALRLGGAGLTTTVAGPVTLSANATIGAAGTGVVSGAIAGGNAANLTIGTSGENGTVVLSGANSYTGTTTVAFGTLQLSTPNALYGANNANWTPANITVNSGATLDLNVGGPNDFTPDQAGILLTNLAVANNNGLLAGATFKFDTSNATAPVVVNAAISNSVGIGGGALSIAKTGLGILNLASAANSYTGTTSVTNGELILSGSNTGTATLSATNNVKLDTTVLSIRNANAVGAGTANSGLAPITLDATGTDLSTSILEIGATIGTDPGGNNADFSYQVVAPGNPATGTAVATNVVAGNGQINLGFLGNSDDGTGFAGYNAAFTGSNVVPPRIVALYTPVAGSTTLAVLEEKAQFGQGSGDHFTLGSPTANTTVILLNEIDLNGGPQRRFASIRGVGITPEGEFAGSIINSAGSALNVSYDGNGGLIFASAASSYNTATLQINGGAVFVAASDPAAAGETGALGEGTAVMQIGTSATINPSGGTAVPTTPGANLGFMTYGANAGVGPAPTEITNRNITVGGADVTYASAVLGGVTDDYSAMNGNITLNEAPTTPTTFTARNGGRVDFGGAISGIGSVVIGNSVVEGDATTPGIALLNNGTIVFNGQNSYTGSTTISAGKLYVNGSTSAASAVSVASGATLGGMGVVNGALTVSDGGILEAGQAGAGTLTLAGGVTFNGSASLNFLSLPAAGNPGLVITGTNTLTTSGGTLSIDILGSITGLGTYALIGYAGVDPSMFTLAAPLPDRAVGTLAVNGNELDLDITSLASIVWTGAANASWNTVATNWSVQGGGSTQYLDGDSVIFDDTAAPHTSVAINGADVHPSAVNFNNNTSTYTVSGTNAIAGSTGLNINGTGTVIFTNANTFTGPTVIASGGTLQLGDGTAGHDGSIASTSSITDNGALVYNLAGSQTYVGVIGGSGSLAVEGAGTLILTNTNTYGGATTITGGTLQLGNGTVDNDGSVAGVITDNGALVFNYFGSPTFFTAIGGSGSVTKTGAGALTLEGTNSYSGATNVLSGGLIVGAGASLGGTSNITVNSGATFTIADGGTISPTAGLTNNGTVVLNSPAVSLGALNGTNAAATLTLNATSLTVTAGGSFAGIIQNSGGLTVAGGALTLTAANPYTGSTTVTGGTLMVSGALSGTASTTVFPGASLVVNATGNIANSVNTSGTVAGNGTIAGVLAGTGATVAPGAVGTGLGTLTAASLSLDSASTLSIALGGTGAGQIGQVSVGSIDLASDGGAGAILSLSLVNNYVPAQGDFLVFGLNTGPEGGVFQNTTLDSNPNYFGGATFPAIFVGSSEFAVLYSATATSLTGGTDLALLAVPEPGSFGLLLAGFGLTLGLQRFRRRPQSLLSANATPAVRTPAVAAAVREPGPVVAALRPMRTLALQSQAFSPISAVKNKSGNPAARFGYSPVALCATPH